MFVMSGNFGYYPNFISSESVSDVPSIAQRSLVTGSLLQRCLPNVLLFINFFYKISAVT